MIALECRIAALGLGTISEQQEWTVGRWLAVVNELPRLDAAMKLRQVEIVVAPHLKNESFRDLIRRWEDAARPPFRGVPQGVASGIRGLRGWLRGVLGSGLET